MIQYPPYIQPISVTYNPVPPINPYRIKCNKRVTAKTMDCLEFLDSLVEQPLMKHNVGFMISDSPFNSMKEQGRVKIRTDDIL